MAISGGNYLVSSIFTINGKPVPWWEVDLTMNIYSLSSQLRARGPMDSGMLSNGGIAGGPFNASRVTDWGKVTQTTNPCPWKLAIGYVAQQTGDGGGGPAGQAIPFEQGFIDECNAEYDLNEWEFVGRSTASVFQDNPTAATLPRNVTPLTLVQTFFSERGIPLVVGNGASTAALVMGKAFDDENYQRSLRNSSEWDYMSDAATAAGMKLFVHNGVGYFGPAGGDEPDTIELGFPGDLDTLKISHAARRAHDLQVRVDSSNPKKGTRVTATYGTAQGPSPLIRRFFISGLDLHKCKGEAFAIWHELINKEFLANATLYPDDAFMRMLGKNGPNFLVKLPGVIPSHSQIYHVSQANVHVDANEDKPELKVTLYLENHVAAAGAGSFVTAEESSI